MKNPFREYLDREHGAMMRIARALDVTHAAVYQWAESRVPAERVLVLEEMTGISRHDLRPDVFGEATPLPSGTAPPSQAAA